jgi:ankyrin repeat protein
MNPEWIIREKREEHAALIHAALISTALISAVRHGHIHRVKELCDRGADLDFQDTNGKTALIWAAFVGDNDIVKELCDRGANIDIPDKSGKTALMWAKCCSNFDIVKKLCGRGAHLRYTPSDNSDSKDDLLASMQSILSNILSVGQDKVKISQILTKQAFRHHVAMMICARTLPVDLLRLLHEFV